MGVMVDLLLDLWSWVRGIDNNVKEFKVEDDLDCKFK